MLRYRDPDTYAKGLKTEDLLVSALSAEEEETISIQEGRGFPTNGVVLIDNEVILYRERNGNNLEGLTRAAKAAVVLPSVTSPGKYVDGPAEKHTKGSEVKNISSLFLTLSWESSRSYTPNIHRDKVFKQVDRSILLQNIRDFYASKGSKLSVKALFKFIYGEPDVEVFYPGDKMAAFCL